MSTLAYGEDKDGMSSNVAFKLGLHCFLRQKRFSEKEIKTYLKKININYGTSIYTMDHPKSILHCIKPEEKIYLISYKLMYL